MREIRPSGSEGGVAPTRHPYPYREVGYRFVENALTTRPFEDTAFH